MLKAVAISILLLYLVYWTWFNNSTVSRPTSAGPILSIKKSFTHSLESFGQDSFAFKIDGKVKWKETLPESYMLQNGQIIPRDICFGVPDGQKLLASGQVLYNYLKSNALTPSASPLRFDSHVSYTFQKGQKFYFTCRSGRVARLEVCPPHHLFSKDKCRPIDACRGRNDVVIGDPFDQHYYYQCRGNENALRTPCPKDTFFFHDSCRSMKDPSHYCRFYKKAITLDEKSVLHCINGEPVVQTCPKGFLAIDGRCESSTCRGLPDGTRIPLPDHRIGPFKFSPGYLECLNGRVDHRRICSKTWNKFDSNGDNLSHLPLVFDGRNCSVPTFCTNVTSDDPDVIVPVHEFSKHVGNWKRSLDMDRFAGYSCRDGTRKRIALDPGQKIGKRFKREPACSDTVRKVVVPDQYDRYFDCDAGLVERCEENTFFDGTDCRKRIPFAHTFKNFDLFRFDHLSHDNWMVPWTYAKNPPLTCTAPESIRLTNYDICSHSDCINYPFLSQVPFSIAIGNGQKCVYRDRRLVKENTPLHYKFWTQRQVPESLLDEPEPCVMGQRLRSGHFMMDSTIYATCDEKQPFVFCPSSRTVGIERVENRRYACRLNDANEGFLPANTWAEFEPNHLKRILPVNSKTTEIQTSKGHKQLLPEEGVDIPRGASVKLTVTEPVKLEYNYTVTHPPDVVFEENVAKVSTKKGAFIVKRKDFTLKALTFPLYEIKDSVSDFAYDERN